MRKEKTAAPPGTQTTATQPLPQRWGEPRYLTIGHTFTETGVRVDVVREWSLVKAIHRNSVWQMKKNNEFLKTIEEGVAPK